MVLEHFLAVIPLLILLMCSLIWYGKGLLHLMLIAYSIVLAYIALIDSANHPASDWSILFFPLCAGCLLIGLILFTYSMTKGDWL